MSTIRRQGLSPHSIQSDRPGVPASICRRRAHARAARWSARGRPVDVRIAIGHGTQRRIAFGAARVAGPAPKQMQSQRMTFGEQRVRSFAGQQIYREPRSRCTASLLRAASPACRMRIDEPRERTCKARRASRSTARGDRRDTAAARQSAAPSGVTVLRRERRRRFGCMIASTCADGIRSSSSCIGTSRPCASSAIRAAGTRVCAGPSKRTVHSSGCGDEDSMLPVSIGQRDRPAPRVVVEHGSRRAGRSSVRKTRGTRRDRRRARTVDTLQRAAAGDRRSAAGKETSGACMASSTRNPPSIAEREGEGGADRNVFKESVTCSRCPRPATPSRRSAVPSSSTASMR